MQNNAIKRMLLPLLHKEHLLLATLKLVKVTIPSVFIAGAKCSSVRFHGGDETCNRAPIGDCVSMKSTIFSVKSIVFGLFWTEFGIFWTKFGLF